MKSNYAFIFARGGSKELKNKNIKLFNGKPLIFYSIDLAKKNKKIKKIFVSSDNAKILKIARKYGANTIIRPKYLSNDKSSEIRAWKHAIRYLKKKNDSFDNFISLPCTSPLRIEKDINLAINKITKENDIVLAISKSNKFPDFNMVKKRGNKVELLRKRKFLYNRQESKKTFNLTTVIYACSSKFVLKIKKSYWEGNVKFIEIPKIRSIDIDDKIDFKLAEIIYKTKNI
tara:strand:+ start:1326 stop:2015 length:690 start_codon:yes stop_codon:yes gene_type:complete